MSKQIEATPCEFCKADCPNADLFVQTEKMYAGCEAYRVTHTLVCEHEQACRMQKEKMADKKNSGTAETKTTVRRPDPPIGQGGSAMLYTHGCEIIRRDDGLTESEGEVMDALVTAWNKFCGLERQHPDETRDFADGIHRCQDLLAVRVARRAYPNGWPIK